MTAPRPPAKRFRVIASGEERTPTLDVSAPTASSQDDAETRSPQAQVDEPQTAAP